ncbi:MAG: hypothetical protein EOP49_04945 [Sphingobacteriales bacterium]|nr:MAG: hypothetical protein EOP49_04945 [Sphingobacteriales bacterium]
MFRAGGVRRVQMANQYAETGRRWWCGDSAHGYTRTQMCKGRLGKRSALTRDQCTVPVGDAVVDAAAFNVFPDAMVDELLRQLPGVEVDAEGNATAMGESMTKLRVNGKDFFTNDVKEFISKLPAYIVDKIQVIDDFGDQANFTGIKEGKPQKMLNIVTKPGLNKGTFGSVGINSGTNDQYGLQGNGNIWRDTRQIGFSSRYNHADNGAGSSDNAGGGANYRNTFGKTSLSFNYNLNDNRSANESLSNTETVNTIGTIYDNIFRRANNESNMQSLNTSLQTTTKKMFLNVGANFSYSNNSTQSVSASNKTGIIQQDFFNGISGLSSSPVATLNISMSRKFAKPGKGFSLNLSSSLSGNNSDQNIDSRTFYYDAATGTLAKDSLLNRALGTDNRNLNTSISSVYSMVLGMRPDSARRNLSFNYRATFGSSNSNQLTNVIDAAGISRYVDSLSTDVRARNFSNGIGITYGYNAKKLSYSLGLNATGQVQNGSYFKGTLKRRVQAFIYSPVINMSYKIGPTSSLGAYYNGTNVPPTAYQLQPVRNVQNLQNTVIGNPDLKPSFSHNMSVSYNKMQKESGRSLMLSLMGGATQNQIVMNVVLLKDTLNSLKQETRFLNVNGTYSVRGNYSYNIPINKNKYNISFRGGVGFANNISYADNVKNYNRGINVSQSLATGMFTKTLQLNASAGYSYSTNSFSLLQFASRDIQTWNFGLNGSVRFWKGTGLSVMVTKQLNSGYVLSNTSPLLISANIGRGFFKNKLLSLNLSANDLLNQGNNLARSINGNTVTDVRTNQITRIFTAGLSLNLQKFGNGRKMAIEQ